MRVGLVHHTDSLTPLPRVYATLLPFAGKSTHQHPGPSRIQKGHCTETTLIKKERILDDHNVNPRCGNTKARVTIGSWTVKQNHMIVRQTTERDDPDAKFIDVDA